MSDFSPPPSRSSSSQNSATSQSPLRHGKGAPGGFRFSTALCWCIIVLVVAFTAVRVAKMQIATTTHPVLDEGPNTSMLIAARYVVGTQHALRGMPAKTDVSAPVGSALGGMTKTPENQLRILITQAEISQRAPADDVLRKLAHDHPRLGNDVAVLRHIYDSSTPAPTAAQAAAFDRHEGWFGDLARSFGKSDSAPIRVKALAAARRTWITLTTAFLIVAAACFVGLALFITALILLYLRKIRLRFARTRYLPEDRQPYLEAFTIYLVLLLVLPLFGARLGIGPPWAYVSLPVAFILGVIWPFVRPGGGRAAGAGGRWKAFCAAVGLHVGEGVFREIGAGIIGYLAGLPLLVAGGALVMFLSKFAGFTPSHPIERHIPTGASSVLLLFLLASVYVPITEELMFRGALFGSLRRRTGFLFSAIVTALVFASVHPQGWPAIPALAALAFTFASMREWRSSSIPSMTAHAINNASLLAILLLALS